MFFEIVTCKITASKPSESKSRSDYNKLRLPNLAIDLLTNKSNSNLLFWPLTICSFLETYTGTILFKIEDAEVKSAIGLKETHLL